MKENKILDELVAIRQQQVVSARELSQRFESAGFKISEASITKRERGEVKVNESYIKAFCKALKLSKQDRVGLIELYRSRSSSGRSSTLKFLSQESFNANLDEAKEVTLYASNELLFLAPTTDEPKTGQNEGLKARLSIGQSTKSTVVVILESVIESASKLNSPNVLISLQELIDLSPKSLQIIPKKDEHLFKQEIGTHDLCFFGKSEVWSKTPFGYVNSANKEGDNILLSLLHLSTRYGVCGEKALEIITKHKNSSPSYEIGYEECRISFHRYNSRAEREYLAGNYLSAEQWFIKSLEVCETATGSKSLATSESHQRLAKSKTALAKYKEADKEHEKALKIYKAISKNHPLVAVIYSQRANLLTTQAKFSKASKLHQKAKELGEKYFNKNSRELALIYNNYALYLHTIGDYNTAREFFLRSLNIRLETLGEGHSDTAESYHNLALNLMMQRNYDSAADFFDKALDTRQNNFGKDHPLTADTISEKGRNQLRQLIRQPDIHLNEKLLEPIKNCFNAAVAIGESKYPRSKIDHPSLAKFHLYKAGLLTQLAKVVKNDKESDNLNVQACEGFKLAQNLFIKSLGENHPRSAEALLKLALHKCTSPKDKIDYLKQTADLYMRTLGSHPYTATCCELYGDCLMENNNPNSARKQYERALTCFNDIDCENYPAILKLRTKHSAILAFQGKFVPAKENLEDILNNVPENLNLNSLSLAQPQHLLARVLMDLESYDDADRIYENALRSFRKTTQSERLQGAHLFCVLSHAECKTKMEKYDEAVSLFKKTLDEAPIVGGEERLWTNFRVDYAFALSQLGYFSESEEQLNLVLKTYNDKEKSSPKGIFLRKLIGFLNFRAKQELVPESNKTLARSDLIEPEGIKTKSKIQSSTQLDKSSIPKSELTHRQDQKRRSKERVNTDASSALSKKNNQNKPNSKPEPKWNNLEDFEQFKKDGVCDPFIASIQNNNIEINRTI